MALNAFTRELGSKQGRIIPAGWTAPAGSYVFVLGFDGASHFEELNIGDFAEVSQTAEFGAGARVVRVRTRFRPPASMPAGAAWKFSIKVDATELYSRVIAPGRTLDRSDIGVNVSKVGGGNHALTFRLELVAT